MGTGFASATQCVYFYCKCGTLDKMQIVDYFKPKHVVKSSAVVPERVKQFKNKIFENAKGCWFRIHKAVCFCRSVLMFLRSTCFYLPKKPIVDIVVKI
jgi:hypothetical protein